MGPSESGFARVCGLAWKTWIGGSFPFGTAPDESRVQERADQWERDESSRGVISNAQDVVREGGILPRE